VTAPAARIPYLDGWRGLAILGVLTDHFLGSHPLNPGRLGVELFFVLSGRLMAEILFERRAPLPVFFRRRAARIYPALAVFVVAIFIVARVTGCFTIPVAAVLSALTFTANYYSIYAGRVTVLDHIWSLCIEEHMYLLLGAIACLARRRGLNPAPTIAALAALFIANGMVRTWGFGADYYAVYWRTDVRGASILIGAAAYLYVARPGRPAMFSAHPALPLLAGAAAIPLNLQCVPDPIKYSLGTICLAVCLCTLRNIRPAYLALLETGWLRWAGMVSYAVYLWQQPFALIGPPVWRVASLPLVLLCALASFYLAEQPCRAWLNRKFA
jgi:peptidoglycan/LPS O-acetylase OafA/YrhL